MPDIDYLPPELASRIIIEATHWDAPQSLRLSQIDAIKMKEGLLKLAVVSPSFLELVRPLLYRHVSLVTERSGAAFLETLKARPIISTLVRTFLTNELYSIPPCWEDWQTAVCKEAFQHLEQLEQVALVGASKPSHWVYGEGLSMLAKLQHLTTLDLSFCDLPRSIPALPLVVSLTLSCVDPGPSSALAASLPSLTYLSIFASDYRALKNSIPVLLDLAPRLKFLRLEQDELQSEVVGRVLSLGISLERLEISAPDRVALNLDRLRISPQMNLSLPELVIRQRRWRSDSGTIDSVTKLVSQELSKVRKIDVLLLEDWVEETWVSRSTGESEGAEALAAAGIEVRFVETVKLGQEEL